MLKCVTLFRRLQSTVAMKLNINTNLITKYFATNSNKSSVKIVNPPSSSRTSYEIKSNSPYRQPGPRRYGYNQNRYTGGLLPRLKSNAEVSAMPAYKPKDSWSTKKALFGQNDYIDILGDGSVHPVDLIKGPPWLIGFKGNELQRLSRQVKFEGRRLSQENPTKRHEIYKNMFYLYKKLNFKRSKFH